MPIENEKKFLVKYDDFKYVLKTEDHIKNSITQGILFSNKYFYCRIRRVDNCITIMTIKETKTSQKRLEIEYPLIEVEGIQLFKACKNVISKNRYRITSIDNINDIIIDEYKNDLKGLYISEIENQKGRYKIPKWCYKEVTGISEFYTEKLCNSINIRKNALSLYKKYTR